MPTKLVILKRKTTLQHLKLGKLKFRIRKSGCSMSWTTGQANFWICGKTSLEGHIQLLLTVFLSIPFDYLPSVVHQELQGLNEVLPWASSDGWSFNNYVDMILSFYDQLKFSFITLIRLFNLLECLIYFWFNHFL